MGLTFLFYCGNICVFDQLWESVVSKIILKENRKSKVSYIISDKTKVTFLSGKISINGNEIPCTEPTKQMLIENMWILNDGKSDIYKITMFE